LRSQALLVDALGWNELVLRSAQDSCESIAENVRCDARADPDQE
jgi:hypothetical protein